MGQFEGAGRPRLNDAITYGKSRLPSDLKSIRRVAICPSYSSRSRCKTYHEEEKLEPLFLRRRKITKTSQNSSSTRVGFANVQRIILCSKTAYSQRKAILLVHLLSRCTISQESACKTPRGNNRIRLAIIGPAGSSTAEVDTAHDLSSDRYGRRFLVNALITLQISS